MLCRAAAPPCVEVQNKALLAALAAPARDQAPVNDPPAARRGVSGQQQAEAGTCFVNTQFLLPTVRAPYALQAMSPIVTGARTGVEARLSCYQP